MQTRMLAGQALPEIGLGCMNLSHAYAAPPTPEVGAALLRRAFELGIRHFDTAALYGFGANETLVGATLAPLRREIFLASKCGMTGVDGKRVIDGRPATIRRTCHESLARLKTEVIDLYYLHRWDRKVPIEDSVGALAELVHAGLIRAIGLSEVSAATLRRAQAVHPIAAVQSEYSLWTRNPEIALLAECRRLGITLVAFSPLARGFLAGGLPEAEGLQPRDIRRDMPRFKTPHYAANLRLLQAFEALARQAGCSNAQLALAWLLHAAPDVVPIPGTTSIAHLEDNLGAAPLRLDAATLRAAGELINERTVSGARYNAAVQAEIDTEEFGA
jgi:aryl-alcohol dehydrogenase-like predicted oxidoreductase